MDQTEAERLLLQKMDQGLLDGPVDGVWQYFSGLDYAFYGKYIKNGIPTIFKEDYPMLYVDSGSIRMIPGERRETQLKTDREKLQFLQKYGCYIKDPDAQEYCAGFTDEGKYLDMEHAYYDIASEPETGRKYWRLVFTGGKDEDRNG